MRSRWLVNPGKSMRLGRALVHQQDRNQHGYTQNELIAYLDRQEPGNRDASYKQKKLQSERRLMFCDIDKAGQSVRRVFKKCVFGFIVHHIRLLVSVLLFVCLQRLLILVQGYQK